MLSKEECYEGFGNATEELPNSRVGKLMIIKKKVLQKSGPFVMGGLNQHEGEGESTTSISPGNLALLEPTNNY